VRYGKWKKKVLLSERSEFQHFPIFRDAQIVPTRSDGTRSATSQRRLSFAFFSLATQRKKVAAGSPPAWFYEVRST